MNDDGVTRSIEHKPHVFHSSEKNADFAARVFRSNGCRISMLYSNGFGTPLEASGLLALSFELEFAELLLS